MIAYINFFLCKLEYLCDDTYQVSLVSRNESEMNGGKKLDIWEKVFNNKHYKIKLLLLALNNEFPQPGILLRIWIE